MNPRVRHILEAVAAEHKVRVSDLLGPSRVRQFAYPRFHAMHDIYQLRTVSGRRAYSLPMIGMVFDRDHTTILNGIRRWQELTGFVDADLLMIERSETLARIQRFLGLIDKARARINQIDRAMAKLEAA